MLIRPSGRRSRKVKYKKAGHVGFEPATFAALDHSVTVGPKCGVIRHILVLHAQQLWWEKSNPHPDKRLILD